MDFKLPALPTALTEVIKIQRAPSPDPEALVEIIERLLTALAQTRNLDVEALDAFIDSRCEDVQHYAQSLVHLA